MVAVLFAVENFISRQADRGTAVATDEECLWSRPRKESLPIRASELDFRHRKDTPQKEKITSTYKPSRTVNNDAILSIRQNLMSVCKESQHNAIFLTAVEPKRQQVVPPTLPELIKDFQTSSSNDPVNYVCERICDSHRSFLAGLSQDDPVWLAARIGRITASLAGDVNCLKSSVHGLLPLSTASIAIRSNQ